MSALLYVLPAGLAGIGCLVAGWRAEVRQQRPEQDRSIENLQGCKNDHARR